MMSDRRMEQIREILGALFITVQAVILLALIAVIVHTHMRVSAQGSVMFVPDRAIELRSAIDADAPIVATWPAGEALEVERVYVADGNLIFADAQVGYAIIGRFANCDVASFGTWPNGGQPIGVQVDG